jgi:hypothetical protein
MPRQDNSNHVLNDLSSFKPKFAGIHDKLYSYDSLSLSPPDVQNIVI